MVQPQIAIATKAKAFVASPIVQSIVNDMYTGRIFFTTTSKTSIVADNYKQRAIEVYDVRKAPFLDHYRSLLFFADLLVMLTSTQAESSSIFWYIAFHGYRDTPTRFRSIPTMCAFSSHLEFI